MTAPLLSVGDGVIDLVEIVEAHQPVERELQSLRRCVSATDQVES